ncbi:hypothetical protein ACFOMD_16865 [Sphingoaurantiacus capsulatus]|uniref:Uncharacterized protein n=1 Tax=Sphingoaurantiacus capsulatus TaxID=1771310 RepID=A0ABV7XG29_9SPHN
MVQLRHREGENGVIHRQQLLDPASDFEGSMREKNEDLHRAHSMRSDITIAEAIVRGARPA